MTPDNLDELLLQDHALRDSEAKEERVYVAVVIPGLAEALRDAWATTRAFISQSEADTEALARVRAERDALRIQLAALACPEYSQAEPLDEGPGVCAACGYGFASHGQEEEGDTAS